MLPHNSARFATLLLLLLPLTLNAAELNESFDTMPDQVWLGPQFWANPLESWQVKDGRLEAVIAKAGQNVQVLTAELGGKRGDFTASVRLGLLQRTIGDAGFVLTNDPEGGYKGACFHGAKTLAVVTGKGGLVLGKKKTAFAENEQAAKLLKDVTLTLNAKPSTTGDNYDATLTLTATKSGEKIAEVTNSLTEAQLTGNVALVQNGRNLGNAKFWFDDLKLSGERLQDKKERALGPILFAMYTINNTCEKEGYVLTLSAQLPVLAKDANRTVILETGGEGKWKEVGRGDADVDACVAKIVLKNWDATKTTPYRLRYDYADRDGNKTPDYFTGTLRSDPKEREEFVIAGLTCFHHTGYPWGNIPENLTTLNPDLVFFSGDQIYELNGGFGIIRTPDETALLSYLRKWWMFGWAFRDVMRHRPTISLPDDHDVFHGNLWGEGGSGAKGRGSSTSDGYVQSARFVNAVHRTQTSQLPMFDPTPAKRGTSVYYGDVLWGGVSCAFIGDRMFKSGPNNVDTGSGRSDHVRDKTVDTTKLDKPGLTFLGERQMKFLDHWVEDWKGAQMKVLLSETTWVNVATHHGGKNGFLYADLDSGGWPQSPRTAAIRSARRCFPVHLNGDQHLPTLTQYGIDAQRDAFWSFNTPAASVGYQRWWRPDEVGYPCKNRPEGGGPNTGEYKDGFGNLIYVAAVANPTDAGSKEGRYPRQQGKSAGFGILRLDKAKRTYTAECYRFLPDLAVSKKDAQFAGWPQTIKQLDNYAAPRAGTLGEFEVQGVTDPVVKVFDEKTGKLVYAIRLQGPKVKPWVYKKGTYTLEIGDPDTGKWEKKKGLVVK